MPSQLPSDESLIFCLHLACTPFQHTLCSLTTGVDNAFGFLGRVAAFLAFTYDYCISNDVLVSLQGLLLFCTPSASLRPSSYTPCHALSCALHMPAAWLFLEFLRRFWQCASDPDAAYPVILERPG